MDDPERRALAMRLMRDERWSPEEISGRIAMEHPGLAVSDDSIYRAVESGSSRLRASGIQEGIQAAQAPWKAQAREGQPGAQGEVPDRPRHLRKA